MREPWGREEFPCDMSPAQPLLPAPELGTKHGEVLEILVSHGNGKGCALEISDQPLWSLNRSQNHDTPANINISQSSNFKCKCLSYLFFFL